MVAIPPFIHFYIQKKRDNSTIEPPPLGIEPNNVLNPEHTYHYCGAAATKYYTDRRLWRKNKGFVFSKHLEMIKKPFPLNHFLRSKRVWST